MYVSYTRVDKSLPLEDYPTPTGAWFYLVSRKDTILRPGESQPIPLNLMLQVPENTFLMLVPHSTLFLKKGLICPSGVEIIGPENPHNRELHMLLLNMKRSPVEIARGYIVARGIFGSFEQAAFMEQNL